MKRQFITFSEGEDYNNLCDVLKDSISTFSKYGLTVFNSKDFDIPWEPDKWKPGFGFIFKVLSCLKALEMFDEVVWLDTDIVTTSKIDEIWNYKNQNYPLLPRYRFSNFINWPHPKMKFNDRIFLPGGKQMIGVYERTDDFDYLQACCMKFDINSRNFLEEVLTYFNNFQSDCFPLGDESIINILLYKYNFIENLGDIFLCSHHFDYYHIEKFFNLNDSLQEYQDLFNIKLTPEDEEIRNMYKRVTSDIANISYKEHNRLGLINCNNQILFLHGNKSYKTHRHYLDIQIKVIKERKDISTLCKIMSKFGSDKSTSHNYTEVYHHLFSKFIGQNINIFELGLGTNNSSIEANMGEFGKPGASLRAWSEYLQNAKVFGADIDKEILFQENNITTFWCDQTDVESINNMWKDQSLVDEQFDIIIDDGLHEWHANYTFLTNSIHKLKNDGYYIIEDLLPISVEQIKQQFFQLKQQYPEFDFNLMELKGREPRIDNNILVIKKVYDLKAIENII